MVTENIPLPIPLLSRPTLFSPLFLLGVCPDCYWWLCNCHFQITSVIHSLYIYQRVHGYNFEEFLVPSTSFSFFHFFLFKFPPNLLCAFTGYLLSVKSLGAPVKFVQRSKAFHVLCLWIRTSKLNCLAQGYKQVPGFYLQTILQTLAQVLVVNLIGVIFCSLFAFNKPCTSFLWSQCKLIHYFLYL